MDLPINAAVMCPDGVAGRSRALIVDPRLLQVTHLVIVEKGYPYYARLVPLSMVRESTHRTIRLRCSRRELAACKVFIEPTYISDTLPYLVQTTGEYPLWPYIPAPVVPPVHREHVEIPPGDVAIQDNFRVLATDGPVGRVDEFLVLPQSGRITHLVLREGHLWGQKVVTIPAALIDRIETDGLRLQLDKHGVEELAPPPARWLS